MEVASGVNGVKRTILLFSTNGDVISSGVDPILNISMPLEMTYHIGDVIVADELGQPLETVLLQSPGEGDQTGPEGYALQQNYPNPFNPTTSINFQIPNPKSQTHVVLRIYNILGQEVATLVNETKTPGYYSVTWDASDMSSGVYVYRLTAGDFTATRSMMLMK
jgi:hypothetical protein